MERLAVQYVCVELLPQRDVRVLLRCNQRLAGVTLLVCCCGLFDPVLCALLLWF